MENLPFLQRVEALREKGDKNNINIVALNALVWTQSANSGILQREADAERQRMWATLHEKGWHVEWCAGDGAWGMSQDNWAHRLAQSADRDECLLAGMGHVLRQQEPVITMAALYARLAAAIGPLRVNVVQCDTLNAILSEVQRAAEREKANA